MMKQTPKKYIKEMALVYEKAWNDVVNGLPKWKQNIIINNFNIIDGHHVYEGKMDTRIANEAAKEARKRADEIIEIKFSGKY